MLLLNQKKPDMYLLLRVAVNPHICLEYMFRISNTNTIQLPPKSISQLYTLALPMHNTSPQTAVATIPTIAMTMPNPCGLETRSFKKTTANIIVTIDKAEAMGVIKMASPMVSP